MIVWIDAQLSPALAPWITETFGVEAISVKRLGLRDARDEEIFGAAREASAVIMTKDVDLVMLLERFGAPPSGRVAGRASDRPSRLSPTDRETMTSRLP